MTVTMDNEHSYDSDEDILEANHNRLLESVSNLDKSQHVKKPTRTEPSLQVSEFNLVKTGTKVNQSVRLNDLATTLNKTAKYVSINKKVKAAQKQYKTLQKPLEKPEAERIKRVVGFKRVRENLKRWDAVVTSNRVSEHIKFPLQKISPLKLKNTSVELISRFKIKSDLQESLERLETKPEEKIEEQEEFPLSLEEIIERRKEAAKFRAQQSYQEAKARRQNKIKSKKFHRIQRKEKIKQQIKEFEQLQKTDPEAALKKLNEIDKVRAEERLTLRHRSTGQWAKSKQVRAKYDKESRQVLSQQLAISRELTQKLNTENSSESDFEETVQVKQSNDNNNPWLNVKPTTEVQEFVSGYRKYWDEKNKNDNMKKQYDLLDIDKYNEVKNCKEDTKIKNIHQDTEIEKNKEKKINERLISDEDDLSVDCLDDDKDLKKFKMEINGFHEEEIITKEVQGNLNKPKENKIKCNSDGDKTSKNKSCISKDFIKMNPERIEKQNAENKFKNKASKQNVARKKKMKVCNLADLRDRIDEEGCIDTTISTSSWVVTPLKGDEMGNLSIDNIFDDFEYKISSKLENKLKNFNINYSDTKKKNDERIITQDKRIIKNEDMQSEFKLQRKKIRPMIDEALDEVSGNVKHNENLIGTKTIADIQIQPTSTTAIKQKTNDIDPTNFINVKPQLLNTAIPELMTTGEEAIDDLEPDENQKMTISEAFEDDDIVAEFQKEKQDDVDRNNPKDIDLTLPGWGSWGGTNIKVSQRKRKRFIVKFPHKQKRRDENKGNVIINESKDAKVKAHQVSEVPFPFNNVSDFEASMRAPIGNTFVTEKAFKRLIKPQVITKMGAIIEPMNDDILINLEKKKRKFK